MNLTSDLLRAAAVVLCLAFPVASIAASMVFTGSASTSSTQVQMPLANGATVVTANATGFAAMTGASAPNPILLELRCSGLGYAMIENAGNIEFYCTFMENDVDLPSGSFTSHLASLRTDFALNSRWSWSNLLQYNNTDERVGINSRLRFIPEAGREMVLVLNHGADLDMNNDLTSTINELNLKVSYTFRY
jgi:hypothetical protein